MAIHELADGLTWTDTTGASWQVSGSGLLIDDTPVTQSGGYGFLQDLLDENRESLSAEAMADPVACPNDGEPLQRNESGRLVCPFDGWTPEFR